MSQAPSARPGWRQRLASATQFQKIAGAVILAAIIFAGSLFMAASFVDAIALKYEQSRVQAFMQSEMASLQDESEVNVGWDEAVQYVSNDFDFAWTQFNIGDFLIKHLRLDVVVIISPEDRELYKYNKFSPAKAVTGEEVIAAASPILKILRARETARGPFSTSSGPVNYPPPIQSSEVARIGARLFLVSATLVQRDHGKTLPKGPRSAIVITGREVNDAFVEKLQRDIVISQASISAINSGMRTAPPLQREASTILNDGAGQAVAKVSWTPSQIGNRLALYMILPLLLLISVPLILFERLGRLSATAAALEEEAAMARSRAAMQQRFLANMSHEIRTPLSGVTSLLEIVRYSKLDADQARLIDTISSSAQSLTGVIDDILDYSSLERGSVAILREPNDPIALVETATRMFLGAAAAKNIALRCFCDPSVRGLYEFDHLRTSQVVGNFISNAIKFTSEGRVTVTVSALPAQEDTASLVFRVTDTGIGIAPDVRKHLFKPFSQADESIARRFGGTGLGLSISRQVAELMGGDIDFDSVVGKGSTFALRLPVRQVRTEIRDDRTLLSGVTVGLLATDPEEQAFLAGYLEYWGAMVSLLTLAAVEDEASSDTFDSLLAPEDTASSVALALDRQGDQARSRFRHFVYYSPQDRAVDRILSNTTLVTTSISRSRIVTAVAVAVGRSSPEPERTSMTLSERAADSPAVSRDARILVAEDSPVNREVILRQLRALGFAASHVGNGEEALAALADGAFDLLLTDCHMPVLDGYELARRIRASEPEGRRLPIIAVTANAMQGVREMCLAAGMDDYLTKPLTLAPLRESLETWLPAQAPGVAPAAAPQPGHPANENRRQAALDALGVLDSPKEPMFDAVVRLAAAVCDTPIAAISLVDRDRQWFKASVGLEVTEMPREVSFCAHAIKGRDVFEVRDAANDPKFAFNALVTGDLNLRFYAGFPLLTGDGLALGALCVVDRRPRILSEAQLNSLRDLSNLVIDMLGAQSPDPRQVRITTLGTGEATAARLDAPPPVMDLAVVAANFGDDSRFLQHGLDLYHRSLSEDLKQLSSAAEARDAGAAHACAHKIKGASGYTGGTRFQTLGLAIEVAADAGDWDAVNENLVRMLAAKVEFEEALKAIRPSLGS